MYLLYSAILSLLFLALLPYFVYQAIRHGKYSSGFRERLGLLPRSLDSDRPTLWVHAVSVGEFNAARPLIAALRRQLEGFRIVVSTATLTGQRLARQLCPSDHDATLYFPFDWQFSVRRALDRIRPVAVVILETELWPNFLHECRRRGITTVLANGRISARSFKRYRRVHRFISRVLGEFSLLVMQSEQDRQRAKMLGAQGDQLTVCGNLKYDAVADSHVAELPSCWALDSGRLIIAGSTAPGEEQMLLEALRELRSRPGLEDVRLLIAPRHPERFEDVARILSRSGFSFVRRSQDSSLPTSPPDVILLDTIGELAGAYRLATVVFVGGSLVPRGGHNVIEPAAFAKPIVVGPYAENFADVVSGFLAAEALVQVKASPDRVLDSLTEELAGLLRDSERAKLTGARARAILDRNRGATECTVAAIMNAIRDTCRS